MSKRVVTILTVTAATFVLGVGPAAVSTAGTPTGTSTTISDLAGGRWGCC